MLQDVMEEVVNKAQKCDELAKQVENNFLGMIDLINELSVACTSARSHVESSSQDAKVSLISQLLSVLLIFHFYSLIWLKLVPKLPLFKLRNVNLQISMMHFQRG
jgi:hypothetical protein